LLVLLLLSNAAFAVNPATWRSRALYQNANCAGNPYEIDEDPVGYCELYIPPGASEPASFQFKTLSATQYQNCIYTDKQCQNNEMCETLNITSCEYSDLGDNNTAWITTSVGPQKSIGQLSMYALWQFNLYGQPQCYFNKSAGDDNLQISLNQCIKQTTFVAWDTNEARYCAWNTDKCTDPYPIQCTVVRLDGCYLRSLNQSYNSSVTYSQTPPTSKTTAGAMVLSVLVVALSVASIFV